MYYNVFTATDFSESEKKNPDPTNLKETVSDKRKYADPTGYGSMTPW